MALARCRTTRRANMKGCCGLSIGKYKKTVRPEQSVEEEDKPIVPDILADANAVLGDKAKWRTASGGPPDYTKADANYQAEKTVDWAPGSLEDMVSNLVKNWEKEASYKMDPAEWRTIDRSKYRFSCNGGEKSSVEDMLRVGTYNALIGETELYSAKNTDFETSHEIFKKAMPGGFSWEVTKVYSGPPEVVFKWRHWGKMTGKLSCPLGKGSLEAEPTNGTIDIKGLGVAVVDPGNGFKISEIEIYYDQNEIMKQLAAKKCPVAAAQRGASEA